MANVHDLSKMIQSWYFGSRFENIETKGRTTSGVVKPKNRECNNGDCVAEIESRAEILVQNEIFKYYLDYKLSEDGSARLVYNPFEIDIMQPGEKSEFDDDFGSKRVPFMTLVEAIDKVYVVASQFQIDSFDAKIGRLGVRSIINCQNGKR